MLPFPEDAEFVCIEGWNEALYEEALLWVDGTRRVAILSEEEQTSADPRVKIYPLESPLQREGLLKKMAWSAVFKRMAVIGSGLFKQELERNHLAVDLILSEAADWWVGPLGNARANRGRGRDGLALKGALAGLPALVVGAGPSLEKNKHLLSAFADRAVILAGGSALNVIGVEPHWAASIDPAAPTRQFKMQPFWETPFCIQSRMNPDNYALLHGERVVFPDSSCGAINWIQGQESFDSGWTVGNFLTAVAAHLGCSPIILVGMDLCYVQERKYAELDAALPDGLVQAEGFLTQRDWLMAARWTEARPERILNATEGGMLRLPTENLERVLEGCTKRFDVRGLVRRAIERAPFLTPRWEEWDASLLKCQTGQSRENEAVYQHLLAPLWEIWRPIFEREVENDPKQTIALHKEAFFQQVLDEHSRI